MPCLDFTLELGRSELKCHHMTFSGDAELLELPLWKFSGYLDFLIFLWNIKTSNSFWSYLNIIQLSSTYTINYEPFMQYMLLYCPNNTLVYLLGTIFTSVLPTNTTICFVFTWCKGNKSFKRTNFIQLFLMFIITVHSWRLRKIWQENRFSN